MARRPGVKPLSERTQRERYEAMRLLRDHKVAAETTYDPEFHPRAVVEFFHRALENVPPIERIETERGDVKYVQAPVYLPTLARFAVVVGVTRQTIWAWAKKYELFERAVDTAKAIQEDMLVNLGGTRAHDSRFCEFVLKNRHGWADKIEQTHRGEVTLHFDAQDESA